MICDKSTGAKLMESKDVRVAALMTAPRYECVAARSRIERSLSMVGIPLTISGGVYYGQCMQSMMEKIIGQVDYVLTVDFDSMFLPKHVRRLLSIIAQCDEIDALAAFQPMRGKGRVLASRQSENEVIWDGTPLKADSAHFGLTVIDAAKLAKLPKPWFCSYPDDNGSWTDDRIDDDVWFWRQWEAAGFSCYVDPGCRLGHLEEMVTVFDEALGLCHHYPKQWAEIAESTCE